MTRMWSGVLRLLEKWVSIIMNWFWSNHGRLWGYIIGPALVGSVIIGFLIAGWFVLEIILERKVL